MSLSKKTPNHLRFCFYTAFVTQVKFPVTPMWLMLQGRPKELVQNLIGDQDCLCLSIQGFPVIPSENGGKDTVTSQICSSRHSSELHGAEALTVPLTQ